MTATRYAYDTQATIQIVAHWCTGCGIPYGLPTGFLDQRRKDHQSWTCPNGCVRYFPKGPDQEQLLRERLKSLESTLTHTRDQRDAAQRSANAQKGVATRIKNRVAKGVCPCCNRTFVDLGRHMAGQHPTWATS